MAGKVKHAFHKRKPVLTVWWPDRLRSRIRFHSEEDGERKKLAAKKSFLKRFKSRFRNVPSKAFNMLHVDRYVASRQKAGVSNASINREVACLKHLFTWQPLEGMWSIILLPPLRCSRNRSGQDRSRRMR